MDEAIEKLKELKRKDKEDSQHKECCPTAISHTKYDASLDL